MGEEKEKLDRLRAKRGGHRTVVTKNINEARTILEHTDLEDNMWSRLKVVVQANFTCGIRRGDYKNMFS